MAQPAAKGLFSRFALPRQQDQAERGALQEQLAARTQERDDWKRHYEELQAKYQVVLQQRDDWQRHHDQLQARHQVAVQQRDDWQRHFQQLQTEHETLQARQAQDAQALAEYRAALIATIPECGTRYVVRAVEAGLVLSDGPLSLDALPPDLDD